MEVEDINKGKINVVSSKKYFEVNKTLSIVDINKTLGSKDKKLSYNTET